MEHEERAKDLETGADELEEHSEQLERHIDEARDEWESKKQDDSVPGAQPPEDEKGGPDERDEQGDSAP